jgi:hypothetical protein
MVVVMAACGKVNRHSAAMATVDGDERSGSTLAYEHQVEVSLPAVEITSRLEAVQAACTGQRHGACTVLDVSQQGGDYPQAGLTMRVEPVGVAPLIALAGEGGDIGRRNTHAEDLAVAVRDNTLLRQRLENERSQLLAFQERTDLAVADMIALSRQLGEVEAQLHLAEQENAQHRRRIDTQKLTIGFEPPRGQGGRNEIAQAVRDFGSTLADGTAWTIRAAAFLIPVGVLLLVLVWGARRMLRLRRKGS